MALMKNITVGNIVMLTITSILFSACSLTSPDNSPTENLTAVDENLWLKIDDFEKPALLMWTKADTKNDTKPKIENPQVTELRQEINRYGLKNQFLIKKPAADGIVGNRKALTYRALPTPVPVGETYTFYTRINVEYFPNNHAFGISNQTPENIEKLGYDAFEPTLRVTDKAESSGLKNDGALMVKVDGGYSNVQNFAEKRSAKPLVAGQWYEIWYVVNNSTVVDGGQKYDVYVKGGEFSEQTLVYKNADFRIKRELPLIYFLGNCNTGPLKSPYGNGGLRYDDLYMTKGVALTTPI